MPEHKKQHFVPQMYFRLFSKDSKTIEQITIKDKVHRKVAIRNVCQKDYMYSKDLNFEKFLSSLEGLASVIIKKILNQDKLSFEEYRRLLSFIGLQNRRTLLEKEIIADLVNKMAKEVLTIEGDVVSDLKNKGITKEFLDELKIEHPGIYIQSLYQSILSSILFLDLKLVRLVNLTQKDLIFSDNPVVLYNRVKWDDREFSLGASSPGLLVFFPINSKNLILLYDHYHYRIKPDVKHIDITNFVQKITYCVGRISFAEDIKKLNKPQYFNCNHTLFFENDNQNKEVLKVIERNESNREKMRVSIDRIPHDKGEILRTYREGISEKIDFTFMEIIRNKTDDIIRTEKLSKWFNDEMDQFQKEIEKQRKMQP